MLKSGSVKNCPQQFFTLALKGFYMDVNGRAMQEQLPSEAQGYAE